MNRLKILVVALLGVAALEAVSAVAAPKYKPTVKADVGLYPNDFGPSEIDVSHYPPKMKLYYQVFSKKCQACHTIARPINSQFLELTDQEISAMKKTQPEIFKAGPDIVKPEEKIWSRYVHRMMSKPGCPVGDDGKKIWEFLVFDSKQRKMGQGFKSWAANRTKLLADFVKLYPKQYQSLVKNGFLAPVSGGK
jgi:hypothetical protein